MLRILIFVSFLGFAFVWHQGNSFKITADRKRQFSRADSVETIIIFFDQSNYNLRQEEQNKLNLLVKKLISNGHQKIRIVGHTDNVGKSQENIGLSENRAMVIRNYLLNRKVSDNQIFYTGVGGKYPISTNDNEEHRKLNRRVEISLLP